MSQIELYSDVVCPWCYIGSVRLERVLATLPTPVDVVYRPFLLRPDMPPEGVDIAKMLRERYGADPKQMFARVEEAAAESGLPLDLSKQPRSYQTIAAHTLIRHAEALGTQRALARALFAAHFDDAKNVSDVEVLVPVATAHGFADENARLLLSDPAELAKTRALAEAASRSGIRGVPFYLINRKLAVSGAQPEDVLRRAIAEAAAA